MGSCSSKKLSLQKLNLNIIEITNLEVPETPQNRQNKIQRNVLIKFDEIQSGLYNKKYTVNYLDHYDIIQIPQLKNNQGRNKFFLKHKIIGQMFQAIIMGIQESEKLSTILNNLEHTSILKFQEIFLNQNSNVIITQCCTGQNLLKFIYQQQTNLAVFTKLEILNQIITSIAFLHQNNLYHGSLGLRSFQFYDESNQLLKLCDFCEISTSINSKAIKDLDIISAQIIGAKLFLNESNEKQFELNSDSVLSQKFYSQLSQIIKNSIITNQPISLNQLNFIIQKQIYSTLTTQDSQDIMNLKIIQELLYYMIIQIYGNTESIIYLDKLKEVKKVTKYNLRQILQQQWSSNFQSYEIQYCIEEIFKNEIELSYHQLINRIFDKRQFINQEYLDSAFSQISGCDLSITFNDLQPFFTQYEKILYKEFEIIKCLNKQQFIRLMYNYLNKY